MNNKYLDYGYQQIFPGSSTNWVEANVVCFSNFGSTLAIVYNALSNTAVADLCESDNCWIAFNDLQIEGTFKWTQANIIIADNYTNWDENEPNNKFGAQDCVQITADTGLWSDDNCESSLDNYVICEKRMLFISIFVTCIRIYIFYILYKANPTENPTLSPTFGLCLFFRNSFSIHLLIFSSNKISKY